MIETRIRAIRKEQGLTLEDLARAVRPEPTTAQTIHRLEKGIRNVTLDWLEKIAEALGVSVPDLLILPETRDVRLIGKVDKSGHIEALEGQFVSLKVRGDRPVAIKLQQNLGVYFAGDVLICNQYDGVDISGLVGQDCLVGLQLGGMFFHRLISGSVPGKYTLVPLNPGEPARHDASLSWAAKVVMLIREYG